MLSSRVRQDAASNFPFLTLIRDGHRSMHCTVELRRTIQAAILSSMQGITNISKLLLNCINIMSTPCLCALMRMSTILYGPYGVQARAMYNVHAASHVIQGHMCSKCKLNFMTSKAWYSGQAGWDDAMAGLLITPASTGR